MKNKGTKSKSSGEQHVLEAVGSDIYNRTPMLGKRVSELDGGEVGLLVAS